MRKIITALQLQSITPFPPLTPPTSPTKSKALRPSRCCRAPLELLAQMRTGHSTPHGAAIQMNATQNASLCFPSNGPTFQPSRKPSETLIRPTASILLQGCKVPPLLPPSPTPPPPAALWIPTAAHWGIPRSCPSGSCQLRASESVLRSTPQRRPRVHLYL